MAHIIKSSDGVIRPKLATKNDMDILNSHARAATFIENEEKRIAELEAEIEVAKKDKVVNKEYIARRVKKIAEIKQSIALYHWQRRK